MSIAFCNAFMDTKRCVYCYKLSPVDAQSCIHCKRLFAQTTGQRRKLDGNHLPAAERSFPSRSRRQSIPPASPHRAGHHPGLHPEDQPYQSSMMAVQRPTKQKSNPLHAASPYNSSPSQHEQQRVHLAAATTQPASAPQPLYLKLPVTPPPEVDVSTLPLLSRPPRKPILQGHNVPTLLIIACLVLLFATSILAYVFISKKPELPAPTLTSTPNQLRANDMFILTGSDFGARDMLSFTRDVNIAVLDGNGKPLKARADDTGAFAVQIAVQASWGPGQHFIHATDEAQHLSVSTAITIQQPPSTPPHLRLSNMNVDFGAGAPGKLSTQNIILMNTGGGQLSWQASSDQPWLTANPNSGTFSGKAVAALTVNRGALAPQTYSGHIMFTQQGSSDPALKVTVTMAVQAIPANLIVSSPSLIYSGSTTQNPPDQAITLQNSGGQPLDWSSTITTGNGAPWLSIHPASGHLEPDASVIVTVSAQSAILAVGSYQGILNFKGGANPQVAITLSVVAPGNLLISPPAVNATTSTGQNAAAQIITLQNSGGQPLDWRASAATTDGTKWLAVAPISGHLEPDARVNISVKINSASLQAGSYQGNLTFSYGTLTKQVAVALTVSTPPTAGIGIQPNVLTFTATAGTNPPPQTFAITDTGNATLNWTLTEDANGATYAPATPTSGSLPPGESVTITVTPNVAQASLGTINATLTIADSDTSTMVPNQQVGVNITINNPGPDVLGLSTNQVTFDNTSTLNNTTQSLTITNHGAGPFDWSIPSSESWLSISDVSGTLAPGGEIVINFTCDSSQLSPGTYYATLTINASNSGTPIASQTVNVTLTVSQ